MVNGIHTFRICGIEGWKELFPLLQNRPALILLYGPMGAGKTTLVREYLKYLGFNGRVKSPTFTYEILYEPLKISHIDMYRLSGTESEIIDEIWERLEDGYTVFVEWPERFEEHLKEIEEVFAAISIHIAIVGEDCRDVKVTIKGEDRE